jgi:adenylate kinase
MKATVLLGPPGSGKGTAASSVGAGSAFCHVSTGALFRDAIREENDIGLAIRPYMQSGSLVPDELVMAVVRKLLGRQSSDACILFDGFPRTVTQAEGLDEILRDMESQVQNVFLLEINTEALIARLGGRLTCPACGAIFNARSKPPRVAGRCDECGEALAQRPDDTEETIRRRQEVYEELTLPLVAYYEAEGLIRRIDASQSPDAVAGALLSMLNHDACSGSPGDAPGCGVPDDQN